MSKSELLMEAGFNTILGIGTVFVMLIIMALIIYCFRIIPYLQKKLASNKNKEEAPVQTPRYIPPVVEEENLVDDLELVAVIAAAIAASEQVPIDGFRVRTIKRRY